MSQPRIIGWKERADFPDWRVARIRVKMDTGARTSSIDAAILDIVTEPDGTRQAVLGLRLFRRRPHRVKTVKAPLVRLTKVRNPGMDYRERLVVSTLLRLGGESRTIELTVADRRRMLAPIILGRRALEGLFLIDSSRKYALPD